MPVKTILSGPGMILIPARKQSKGSCRLFVKALYYDKWDNQQKAKIKDTIDRTEKQQTIWSNQDLIYHKDDRAVHAHNA